jgi:PAS domain S-box-containing protein
MPGIRIVNGIRDKLLIAFSLLVASIAAFVFLFFPARLRDQAMGALVARATTMRDMMAFSIDAALDFGDSVALGELIDGAARASDVQFISVRDYAQREVAFRGQRIAEIVWEAPPQEGFVLPGGSTYVTTASVRHLNRDIGSITIGVSLAGMEREVAHARQLGTLVGVLILAIGIVVVIAISTLVTRPLRAVAQTMNRVAAGELSIRASETGDAEVTELVGAFNRMVDALAGAQSELSRVNQELEGRVTRRTMELTNAIAEQRRVQEALAQSESEARASNETLRSLIDVAPQAIVAVDLEWNVTRWNRAAEKLFGWSAEEVIGNRIPYVPETEIEAFRQRQKFVEADDARTPVEARRMNKTGDMIDVLVASSLMRDRDLRAVGYIAVVTDMTERKSLEEQLRQSQKMEAIGRLAGGVAHDFNNLLTVITSYSAMLLQDTQSQSERDDLEQISAAAFRASALTRQLLTFSRKQIVQLQPHNLGAVVQEMGPMLRRLLRENIQLTTAIGGAHDMVFADKTQLEQVVLNLIVNASDAMPDGGTITVETSRGELDDVYVRQHTGVKPGSYATLVVRDTGTGMDEATMSRIFEPFFTTKEVGLGTGLGLATTYAVVSHLGGHILVTSEVGRGTTFRIQIPIHQGGSAASDVSPAQHAATRQHHGTVLLVEDEEPVRRVIRRSLQQSGFTVIEAPDGEAALSLAGQYTGTIDVLVTDLMMPGINGQTVAARLAEKRGAMRVVFMSGYADDTVDRRGLIDETHVFLQKPFTGATLSDTVIGLLLKRAA